MILSNPFNQDEFVKFVKGFLPNFKADLRKVDPRSSGFREVLRIGTSSEIRTEVLVVRSSKNISSRISLTNNSFKILKAHSIYRALVVYVNNDETIWRLSLLTATPTFVDGQIIQKLSNPRRHSYVLGTDVGIATARKYLSSMGSISTFDDLEQRFSVEAVNKDFYREIAGHFYSLVGNTERPLLNLPGKSVSAEDLQNYAVRLLGRIIFLWFIKQKKNSSNISLLPSGLLEVQDKNQESIYNERLAPLFFEVLNKPLNKRRERFKSELYGDVPYLNGGLFEPSNGSSGDFYDQSNSKTEVKIPNSWFEELFTTLNTYNFTLDENLENDVDLSIDPEMLGRVFENLLAEINPETGVMARKSTGSFYTPRSIVNFMVDESLQIYLQQSTNISSEKIKALISVTKIDDEKHPLDNTDREEISKALSKLRVVDPACGSGAFPMGILQKLVWILSEVDSTGEMFLEEHDIDDAAGWFSPERLNYLRKRKIIRDTIFGVDIQSIAIEIAKLRCFLTLIVDQEIDDNAPNRGVVPLPNLEFKFVCADSLIPLNEEKQMTFGDDPELEDKLSRIRQRYFVTSDEEKKVKLRKEYEKLINQEILDFGESERQRQLRSFRPFEQNSQANFFDNKTMFGFTHFDIIIGNPPYVSALKSAKSNPESREIYKKQYPEVGGAFDLYVVFLLRALKLLKKNGVYTWIIPNKFLVASYAKETMTRLRKTGLKSIVNMSHVKVFEASVYPLVILGSTIGTEAEFAEYQIDNLDQLKEAIEPKEKSFLDDLNFQLIQDSKLKLSSGATGFQAKLLTEYISTKSGKNRIPFTVSGCIDPYKLLDKPVRYMGRSYSPAYIERRDDAIADSKWDLWINEKIVIAGMTKRIEAVYSESPLGLGVGTYAIHNFGGYSPYFLLGLLNSKFLTYFLREKFHGKHLAGGYLAINLETIQQLPLPKTDTKDLRLNEISKWAKKLNLSDLSPNEIKKIQIEIDGLVYELFSIKETEIALIEDSVGELFS